MRSSSSGKVETHSFNGVTVGASDVEGISAVFVESRRVCDIDADPE
jgi:hypothetical protein